MFWKKDDEMKIETCQEVRDLIEAFQEVDEKLKIARDKVDELNNWMDQTTGVTSEKGVKVQKGDILISVLNTTSFLHTVLVNFYDYSSQIYELEQHEDDHLRNLDLLKKTMQYNRDKGIICEESFQQDSILFRDMDEAMKDIKDMREAALKKIQDLSEEAPKEN